MNYIVDNVELEVTEEYKFHPERKWKFDFAILDHKIAVEKEGGIFGHGPKCKSCGLRKRGAHSSAKGILRDMEKYNAATMMGWKILRYTPSQMQDNIWIDDVLKIIKK